MLKCIKATFPEDWEAVNIYPLADLHIGDAHCDLKSVYDQINKIKEDPYGLAILNGDLLNTALRNSVSDVYGEVMKPVDQIVELVTLLTPIKDKIIACTIGNHEARVYKNDGIDIMRLACRELGIEDKYQPEGVLIFLRFGTSKDSSKHNDRSLRRLFTIYATHGSGSGRKEGAKAIRLADLASIVDADIYIRSHVHMPLVMRESFYRTNAGNSSVKLVDKLFVNTAATLDYGGYGQQQEYKPSSMKTPIIRLHASSGKTETIF